jgi:hypothetical protein
MSVVPAGAGSNIRGAEKKDLEMATDYEDSLCGKSDGKIYYVEDETGNEYCVSDDCRLYYRLVKLCRSYFRENDNRKKEYSA